MNGRLDTLKRSLSCRVLPLIAGRCMSRREGLKEQDAVTVLQVALHNSSKTSV